MQAESAQVAPLPWPLCHLANTRLIAWPEWQSPAALEELAQALKAVLSSRDSCIILRFDPAVDGNLDSGAETLKAIARKLHGTEAKLDVIIEASPEVPAFWRRMTRAVDGVITAGSGKHEGELMDLGLGVLPNLEALESWLAQRMSTYLGAARVERIEEALHV